MATAKEELEEITGKAQPRMTDYVFPDRPRDYKPKPRSSAAIDLSRLGTQAGIVGAGFLPGAGVADYFGQFPSAQGGTEPSAVENFQRGNYGTAALQSLGAMGDLAMTVPVAGMAVGSVMKAPRAAQKMLQELPKTDELGFYSQVEKSVMDIPQKKGTGAQFLAQIQKTPGVKAEELQYTGLDQFLAGKPSVTKGEIQDYLDANKVQVREVVLSNTDPANLAAWSSYDIQEILEAGEVFDSDADSFLQTYRRARAEGRRDPQAEAGLEEYLREAGDLRTIGEIEQVSDAMADSTPKFTQFTLPGGENQREIYLTLPAKQMPNRFTLRNNESGGTVGSFDTMEEAQEFMQTTPRDDIRSGNFSIEETTSGTEPVYRVPQAHSAGPKADSNRLAQLRVNDRVIDGKNTLFIEEIQSDWHQTGRKEGYKTSNTPRKAAQAIRQDGYWEIRDQDGDFITNLQDYMALATDEAEALAMAEARIATGDVTRIAESKRVPDAPFKTTWDELALKRAIKLASDEGYDQIAFTTGKTQAQRYDLSKQVEEIRHIKNSDGTYDLAITPIGGRTMTTVEGKSLSGLRENELENLVGKEVAQKIISGEGPQGADRYKKLSGVDLEVGGEGMKGFYDKMLPKKLDKIGKKYGAKVGKTSMDTPDGPVEVWSMELPDDLKETVSTQGQPLFQLGAGAAGTAGIMSLSGEDAEAAQ